MFLSGLLEAREASGVLAILGLTSTTALIDRSSGASDTERLAVCAAGRGRADSGGCEGVVEQEGTHNTGGGNGNNNGIAVGTPSVGTSAARAQKGMSSAASSAAGASPAVQLVALSLADQEQMDNTAVLSLYSAWAMHTRALDVLPHTWHTISTRRVANESQSLSVSSASLSLTDSTTKIIELLVAVLGQAASHIKSSQWWLEVMSDNCRVLCDIYTCRTEIGNVSPSVRRCIDHRMNPAGLTESADG